MGQVGRQPKKNPKLLKTIENCHLLFRQMETYDADVQTDDIDLKEASCQVGTEALPADSTGFARVAVTFSHVSANSRSALRNQLWLLWRCPAPAAKLSNSKVSASTISYILWRQDDRTRNGTPTVISYKLYKHSHTWNILQAPVLDCIGRNKHTTLWQFLRDLPPVVQWFGW